MRYYWGAKHCTEIFCFCVHSGALDLIYSGTSLYEHILWVYLEKKRTHACTFPEQRKEINVGKVRFTLRNSSRKLSHEKVITTACNFWRQIACSFLVKSGNILLLGKKIFEIPPFFQTRLGDLGKKVHACSLRFSSLKGETVSCFVVLELFWWFSLLFSSSFHVCCDNKVRFRFSWIQILIPLMVKFAKFQYLLDPAKV